jgi:hypothetical protein
VDSIFQGENHRSVLKVDGGRLGAPLWSEDGYPQGDRESHRILEEDTVRPCTAEKDKKKKHTRGPSNPDHAPVGVFVPPPPDQQKSKLWESGMHLLISQVIKLVTYVFGKRNLRMREKCNEGSTDILKKFSSSKKAEPSAEIKQRFGDQQPHEKAAFFFLSNVHEWGVWQILCE